MTFNEWWEAYRAKTCRPDGELFREGHERIARHRRVAQDAWYAAIDQSINQQQRDEASRRDQRAEPGRQQP